MGRPQEDAPPPPYTHGQPPQKIPSPPPTAETSHLQQPVPVYPPYPPPQPAVDFTHLRAANMSALPGSGVPQPMTFPPEVQYTQPPAYSQNASLVGAAPGIPVQQKPQQYPLGGMTGRVGPPGYVMWTTGLFDCRDDPMNAVMTCFFPCITFGQIAEIVDEGRSSMGSDLVLCGCLCLRAACTSNGLIYGCVAALIALPCLISCGYRTRLRAKYDLVEAPAPDWASHFLCECCALCQEYRELRNRGLDPAIGWHANMARIQNLQQGVVMAPPVNQMMTG
ncbi:hypothetical protein Taro_022255 [Colocasia esculenta]|uniref:Uncharacterized protein n=1 Tax=Colocasia esculenta TaxID=4460 RepID=A0A843VAR2_COLES|nr:hypothetical protein [Colocasia esculenta]